MAFDLPYPRILVTVAALGCIAAGAYLSVINRSEVNDQMKLERDVKRVNRAIQIYQTHGGKIPGGQSPDEVLARLRRESAQPCLPGLKGSLIDPRLTIRWQKTVEASDNSLRAYWDDSAKQFCLTTTGTAPGVKEFYFADSPDDLLLFEPQKPIKHEIVGRIDAVDVIGEELVVMVNCDPRANSDKPESKPERSMQINQARKCIVRIYPEIAIKNAAGAEVDVTVGQTIRVSHSGTVFVTYPVQVYAQSARIESE